MRIPVAAVANLKGGVGKSTTALTLAETLVAQTDLTVRILLVDIDPQSNLSQLLLTEEGVQHADADQQGVAQLIRLFLESQTGELTAEQVRELALEAGEPVRLSELVDRRGERASDSWISLMPAHTRLRFIEPMLERDYGPKQAELALNLRDFIRSGLDALKDDYDLVIIDCPPNVSALLRACLALADVYITPTMPDELAIWGVKQFSAWMQAEDNRDMLAGRQDDFRQRQLIPFTRYDPRSVAAATRAMESLRTEWSDRTFAPPIRTSNWVQNLPRMAPDARARYNQVYRDRKLRDDLRELVRVFVDFMEKREGVTWRKS